MNKYLLLLLILFASYNLSYSQNSVLKKDSSYTKWSGSITGTGLYQSGNTNKFLIQGRGELKRVNKNLEMILSALGNYGENKGVKDDNSYYGSLTADLFMTINSHLSYFSILSILIQKVLICVLKQAEDLNIYSFLKTIINHLFHLP